MIIDPSLFFSPVPGNYQQQQKEENNQTLEDVRRQNPLHHDADTALSDITNENLSTEEEITRKLEALTEYYQLDDRRLPVRSSWHHLNQESN